MTDDLVPHDIDEAEGDDFTTAVYYDPAVKARAYKMYLNTSCQICDIAADVCVPQETVATWARKGKWRDRKMEIEKELFERASDGYRALIVKHRAPTIERHLRIAEKLEKGIEQVIEAETADPDRVPNGAMMKRMAEALSAATGVSSRAAAITDRAFDTSTGDVQQQGKVPLITLNVMPQLPAEKSVTIDVEE